MSRKEVSRFVSVAALIILCTVFLASARAKLGGDISIQQATLIDDIVKDPEKYKDQDVRIEGPVTKVCQASGCWFSVKGTNSEILVKDPDHKVLVPKDCAGKVAVVQGKVVYAAAKAEAKAGCPMHAKADAKTAETAPAATTEPAKAGCPMHAKAAEAKPAETASPAAVEPVKAGCPMHAKYGQVAETTHECPNPDLLIKVAGVVIEDAPAKL